MIANRNKIKLMTAMIAFLFATTSCVEEYWPELSANADQFLVIDGKITNFPGPYTVTLSTSTTINNPVEIPLSLANVTIIDDQGNQELLNEIVSGYYQTSQGGIQGIIGRSYKINVQLNNGKIYESEFEELKKPVEVDNVEVEESWQFANTELEFDQEGFQFYVSSKRAESSKTYFYYEIEETYEYHSDYKIIFLYDGNSYDSTEYNPWGLAQTRNQDTLRYCWKTQNVGERFSYSTEYLNIPVVNKLPLHFIPFADERLRQKYSILVKQYTISEEAYTFMDKLKQQNDNQDALFTTQPFQIRGNLNNIDDSTEPVLGYFLVASGTNGPRILTKAPGRIRYDNTLCRADTSVETIKYSIELASPEILPVYYTLVYFENVDNPMGEALEVVAFVQKDCLDCERRGGVAIKPEYWDW